MFVRNLFFAALLACAPLSAGAFTISPDTNIANGGTYDIGVGPFDWKATFSGGDGGGSVSFTFGNNLLGVQTLGVTQGTVLQFFGTFDGVTVAWGNGQSQSVVPNIDAALNISTVLGQGASDVLTVSWGAVTGSSAIIDLDISAVTSNPPTVPLPASALLLGTALAGAGAAARRRRKT